MENKNYEVLRYSCGISSTKSIFEQCNSILLPEIYEINFRCATLEPISDNLSFYFIEAGNKLMLGLTSGYNRWEIN